MMLQELIPYSRNDAPRIKIKSEALLSTANDGAKKEIKLTLKYEIDGDDLSRLHWPSAKGPGMRKHELWKNTCFEAFVAAPGDDAYYEINLSPTGDWNVYAFADYRAKRTDVALRSPPAVKVLASKQKLVLHAEILLPNPGSYKTTAELSLTAVIGMDAGARLSYWALQHAAEKPDFHDRRSFVLHAKFKS